MRPASKRCLGLLGGAVLLTLAWPAPSGAQTSLGGYSATAVADTIHLQIFDPTIPLPSNPQVDGGISHTRANTETGPVSRATASYLWPGDVLGDGFEQLTGKAGSKYPVQVNSRYPATSDAPAKNTAQLTDGNGMTTSSNDVTTQADVTGAGISGTNLITNPLAGLCTIFGGKNCPAPAKTKPVPVGPLLAAIVTMTNVESHSTVKVEGKTISAVANTHASELKLLAGLITISGLDITSQSSSNGTKATTSGSARFTGLKIAGQAVDLGDKGVSLGGKSGAPLPKIPLDLSAIGLKFEYLKNTRTVDGANASLAVQGLVITLDTKPLKDALHLSSITSPLAKVLSQIPQLGDQLGPLLGLGPKIVINVGDVSTSASAQPAYVGPPITGSTGGATGGGGTGGGVVGGGTGGTGGTGGGITPGTTGGTTPTGGGTSTPATPTNTGPSIQPAAYGLPGLGTVPRLVILGGLALAGLLGWALRAGGAFLFGAGRECAYGLSTGVPDLRKG